VVHHDIKPENILLDHDDNAYLTDFGVSDAFDPSTFERELSAQSSMPQSDTSSINPTTSPHQQHAHHLQPQHSGVGQNGMTRTLSSSTNLSSAGPSVVN
jgi:serine/threonine protein kinase